MRTRHMNAIKQVAQEQAEERIEQTAISSAHSSLEEMAKHVARRIAAGGRVSLIELRSAGEPQNEAAAVADKIAHTNEEA